MAVSKDVLSLRDKKVVAPLMDHATTHTIAAGIGGVLDTTVTILPSGPETEITTGKRFSSGRECYPYIVTLADILSYFYEVTERGESLDSYILIYPQAHGPCRFGQYHTSIDLVMKREGFGEVTIVSPTTKDSYTLGGQITREEGKAIRVVLWNAIVVGDVLNRLLWRTRPYEKHAGLADAVYQKGLTSLCAALRDYAKRGSTLFSSYRPVLDLLKGIAGEFTSIMDSSIPRKPLVGIIGEIYLRMHNHSNRNAIRLLESFGCETVTASLAEWINYTTYLRIFDVKRITASPLVQWFNQKSGQEHSGVRSLLSAWKDRLKYGITRLYQNARMHAAYASVSEIIDIPHDHTLPHLFDTLNGDYTPDLPGEAILSIATAKTWFHEGYDGIVNIMPFGCMPSNNADWILSHQEAFGRQGFPYLPLVFDDTDNPIMEPMIAVFAEKAKRYRDRNCG